MLGQGRIDCDQILEVVVAAATLSHFDGVHADVGVLIAGDARTGDKPVPPGLRGGPRRSDSLSVTEF